MNQNSRYDFSYLPGMRGWVFRLAGLLCLLGAVGIAWASGGNAGAMEALIFGLCVITGCLLFVVPEYTRYHLAIRYTPPLPDRVDEAFEEVRQNFSEVEGLLREFSLRIEKADNRPLPGPENESFQSEIEIALSELKIRQDEWEEKWSSVLGKDAIDGPRELPSNLLGRALSGSGKGKTSPWSKSGGANPPADPSKE